ncbi:cytochrome P450 [Xylaria flabelliformis]|nr:cytochrome P450 [Xylaria flabelliformis]
MTVHFSVAFGSIASLYLFLRILLSFTQDAQEPPAIETSVPFLGPLIGLLRGKSRYYVALRDKFHLPMYTLRLPFSRIYVLSTPKLIPSVQKQWRTLSLAPFTAGAGKFLGMSKPSIEVMHQDVIGDNGYNSTWIRRITPILGPGKDLDAINRRSVELFLDDLTKFNPKGDRVGFWEWTRASIIKATAESIYGPQNPLRDPKVGEAWKIFEASFLSLAISPLPSLFSKKTWRARETLAAAMTQYMAAGGHKNGSTLVQLRHDIHRYEYNFPVEDVARAEIGNTFAVLGNTTPTAWWFLYHIFSDPKVLSDVRSELEACVRVLPDTDFHSHSIDLACIRQSCPILLSTFQEMLRFRAINAGPRLVMEDVMLEGYLLKKGNIVMIPASVHQTDRPTWGDDATIFDHMRFVRGLSKKGQSRVAFRAFGGGHVLCPGRHFATTEIMALGALLVLQFDISPVSGQWIEPRCDGTSIASGFPVPDYDIPVDVRRRHPDRKWHVTLSGSNETMGIVSEDLQNGGIDA